MVGRRHTTASRIRRRSVSLGDTDMNQPHARLGDTVLVHYTGVLDDGQVIGSSTSDQPLALTLGNSDSIPEFDAAVVGLSVGQGSTVTVEPADGFGEYDPELVVSVTRDQSRTHVRPRDRITIENQAVTVISIHDQHVIVDGNHPLAGETLTFQLELVAILS